MSMKKKLNIKEFKKIFRENLLKAQKEVGERNIKNLIEYSEKLSEDEIIKEHFSKLGKKSWASRKNKILETKTHLFEKK